MLCAGSSCSAWAGIPSVTAGLCAGKGGHGSDFSLTPWTCPEWEKVLEKSPWKKSFSMSWKSLQAALWPPSAKALRQGVGQQESGFLPCREKWRKWRKEKVLLIGSTMKTDGEDPRTLSVWPAKATCCYWVWSGWMSPWLCSYLKNMMWVPGQTVCHGETLHSQ